ncbi:MAG: SGNH/GDSL hydrolase N-terminal domain-containing protein, partial [bacterium]|nr:SGNH/GDSL hydrolase N-terminal domain-containing protein [bacterium]
MRLLFSLFFLLSFLCAEVQFRDALPLLEGRAPQFKEGYGRLPAEMEAYVRPPVWRLGQNSAGIAAHFFSDATELQLRWELLNNFHMVHMAGTGIRGLDLYVRDAEDGWSFVAAGKPYDSLNTAKLIGNMQPEMREYLLYC